MNRKLKYQMLVWVTAMIVILATPVYAQFGNYDPYVHSVLTLPDPMLPFEFGGTGVCSLKPGNNAGTALTLGNPDGNNSNDLMKITITLASGVPNVSDPSDATLALAALGGPGKEYWEWSYVPATTTPGTFFVRVNALPDYTLSPMKAGVDATKDSDFGRYTPFSSATTLKSAGPA